MWPVAGGVSHSQASDLRRPALTSSSMQPVFGSTTHVETPTGVIKIAVVSWDFQLAVISLAERGFFFRFEVN